MKINFSELLLLPNIITVFRLFLILPILYILLNYKTIYNFNYILVALLVIAFISDLSDGYIARKTHKITETGKLLDPLADKTLTIILVIFLWQAGYVTIGYLLLLIFRDIAIFTGGIYIAKVTGNIVPSNYVGKATILTIGIYFLSLLLFKNHTINLFLMYLSVMMSIISLFVYLFRAIKILKSYGSLQQ